ncbi:hypothetical protein ASPCAL03279 [Aspergillus calidoustus]|uniref:(S)-ureidoglycine aminohydrolase cupin domain-containing protein n=1 Tax=Aspergillus calidoustus TaxID=454130 RepID=A0A0U5FRS1_ASPCI|nr:hypothetical protein ASPCAL03279 [Aspergillus calidoustus]
MCTLVSLQFFLVLSPCTRRHILLLSLWRAKQLLLSLPHTSSGISLADILGTDPSALTTPDKTTSTSQTTHEALIKNPIVGSWFRMEAGPEATPPTYEYDELGVVIEGEITLRDETGQTTIVRPGDVFFFPRGSTITFSSASYGAAWKCARRIGEVTKL